jgi:hypothetical protein
MCVRAYASGQNGACIPDNLAPARTPRTCHFYSLARQALQWARLRLGKVAGEAFEGKRSEEYFLCDAVAPSLSGPVTSAQFHTNLRSLLQHPASRCQLSKGPLASSHRQPAPFLPCVQTAEYNEQENLAGQTNSLCCLGHDDAACLMSVLRHSFAAQPTALQGH